MIQKRLRYIVMLLLALGSFTARAQLVINELMQSNVDGIMDDLNDFPDSWVELYNAGGSTVSLSEYRLGVTDDAGSAWRLPAIEVPPGGYQLVYCDKEATRLHTDFRLDSGKGCEVFLYRGAALADHVGALPKQPAPNVAYGRQTDGSGSWGYQLTPTPGRANGGGICDADHILGSPVFSQTGGVWTGSHPIRLELSLPEGTPEGTSIYYTTNGREPTNGGNRYTSPISISTNTVIKAKLFRDGWLSPMSTTQSYIYLPRQLTLPVVSIVTRDDYLNGASIGIFANNKGELRTLHKNWRRPMNIEYFEGEDQPSVINQLCEARVGGGNSRQYAKKTLIVYAHKRFGTKRFSHEFFPDQKPGLTEFKSLSLRNAGNDFDYLYMRDAIAQRNMGMHADLDWQAWQPAIIYINGNYYGMLNIRERANEDNVYTNHDKQEDIDLFENWDNFKEGDWDNLNRFTAFYSQSGHTMAEYEKWMDCREFMNLMAMELYYNNLDFPGNNIVMWRPRTADGRWRWIAKDVDYAMGLYGDPYNYKTIKWFYDPHYDSNRDWNANGPQYTLLFRQLMKDKDFAREFVERCAIYMGDFLNDVGTHKVWDPMYEKIKYEYPYHRRLISLYWPVYSDEIKYASNWISRRTTEFYRQLSEFYYLGTPIPMQINTGQGTSPLSRLTFNGVRLSEGRFDGRFFQDHTITLEGEAADGMTMVGWWVRQTTGNTTTSQEYYGDRLTLTMPACSQLVIEPICYDLANGIEVVKSRPQAASAVYDLRGRMVRSGSTSLEGLPKGLYIVNGKKVVH